MAKTPPSSVPFHPGRTSTSRCSASAGPTSQSGVRTIPRPSRAAKSSASELSETRGPDGRTVFRSRSSFLSVHSGQFGLLVKPRQTWSANSSGFCGFPAASRYCGDATRRFRKDAIFRDRRELSRTLVPTRIATSKPSATTSTWRSAKRASIRILGCLFKKSGSKGAIRCRPKVTGKEMRKRPRGLAAKSLARAPRLQAPQALRGRGHNKAYRPLSEPLASWCARTIGRRGSAPIGSLAAR